MSALRLDLLKLVYRADHTSEQLIARAKELEAYVTGQATQAPANGSAKIAADKRKSPR